MGVRLDGLGVRGGGKAGWPGNRLGVRGGGKAGWPGSGA